MEPQVAPMEELVFNQGETVGPIHILGGFISTPVILDALVHLVGLVEGLA